MDRSRMPAVLVALAVLLAACAPGGTSTTASAGRTERAVTLLLGYRPDVQFAPFYVAQQGATLPMPAWT